MKRGKGIAMLRAVRVYDTVGQKNQCTFKPSERSRQEIFDLSSKLFSSSLVSVDLVSEPNNLGKLYLIGGTQ